jgi:hypothetical protein
MAKRGPNFSDYFTNLNQPMPLKKKLTRLTVNISRRVVHRTSCCGNHGEPGC